MSKTSGQEVPAMQRSDAENARRASRGQSRKVQSDASQTRRNTSPDMSAPLLLIVEDELAIQELIVFVCEAEGFRTTRAGSIAEARSALAAERPDLILLDRMLPDRPGNEIPEFSFRIFFVEYVPADYFI